MNSPVVETRAGDATRRRANAGRLAAAALAVAALGPTLARAQPLSVESLEHGSWATTVSALQHNLRAQGSVVHVVVSDPAGDRAPCGSYTLALDATGAQAFRILDCDPATQATALQLVSRHALFSPGDPVAQPRSVRLVATATRVQETSDGARAGGELTCSVSIRPYLDDVEQGTHFYLRPPRYRVRTQAAGVSVSDADGGAGWVLRSGPRASLRIDYEVVDRESGQVVLRDTATLRCDEPTAAQANAGVAATLPTEVGLYGDCAEVPIHPGESLEVVDTIILRVPSNQDTGLNRAETRSGLQQRAAELQANAVCDIMQPIPVINGAQDRSYRNYVALAVRTIRGQRP